MKREIKNSDFIILNLSLFSLLFFSCTSQLPRSLGPLREVTVITDHWGIIRGEVEKTLSQPIPTPQPEPEFLLRVGTTERFLMLSRFRLILLIGTSEDTLFRRILGERLDSLPDGDAGLFLLPNPWVKNQWVLMFVAKDTKSLIPGWQRYQQRIHQTITEKVLEQIAKGTYQKGMETRIIETLKTKFGFTLDVPRKWLLQDKDSASHFLYTFTHFPDRSIFIYWQDTTLPLIVDSVLNLRDRLTGRFYDGDSVDRQEVVAETTQFLGSPTLRIRGVWQNSRRILGGPFVLYAFVHQGRFFLLDGVVFNPGEKKLSNLFQLEAIIRTFRPTLIPQ